MTSNPTSHHRYLADDDEHETYSPVADAEPGDGELMGLAIDGYIQPEDLK